MCITVPNFVPIGQSQSSSNHCRDIVIFGFFRMAATAILDFLNFKFLTIGTVRSVELRHRAKFCQSRLNEDMVIF